MTFLFLNSSSGGRRIYCISSAAVSGENPVPPSRNQKSGDGQQGDSAEKEDGTSLEVLFHVNGAYNLLVNCTIQIHHKCQNSNLIRLGETGNQSFQSGNL